MASPMDIITALSKIENLFIVARNSTFTYKGQAVDVRRVGREQGVRYVLEGSVRRAGKRLRITSQLATATARPSCSPAPFCRTAKRTAPCRRQEGRKPKTPRFLALARPLSGILPLG
jgi:hypothetical protein